MNFKDVLYEVQWNDVESLMKDYYYNDNDDWPIDCPKYKQMFGELHFINAVETKMRLCLEHKYTDAAEDEADNYEHYIEVIGRDGSLVKESSDYEYFKDNISDEAANAESTYAIEFSPWEKWLGMEIDSATIKQFSFVEIIVHSLFEMTFISFDQSEIQEEIEELNSRVEEINNMTEEEKEKKLIPWEQVKKRYSI